MRLDQIGAQIRAARLRQRRTQADVAQSIGMSRATVSLIENGKVIEVGVRKLMALCENVGLELTVAEQAHYPTLEQLRKKEQR
jgi:transcriptional regulator with XRE-family HTH domain